MTAKADRAQALIDDPVLKEAFANIRELYRDKIEETPVSDDTALLDIRKMLYLLRQVEENLHTMIQDGHVEDFNVSEQQGKGILRNLLNVRQTN